MPCKSDRRRQDIPYKWPRGKKKKTYGIGPLNPHLELSQSEMNLNTEHDRPVLLSALTRHGLGARSQWGQISSHEAQRGEIV